MGRLSLVVAAFLLFAGCSSNEEQPKKKAPPGAEILAEDYTLGAVNYDPLQPKNNSAVLESRSKGDNHTAQAGEEIDGFKVLEVSVVRDEIFGGHQVILTVEKDGETHTVKIKK